MISKNTICLWYDGTALDAATFYAQTFPDSAVGTVLRAPGDYPAGKQGDVLTVEFTVMGIPCLGLNGGPECRPSDKRRPGMVRPVCSSTSTTWPSCTMYSTLRLNSLCARRPA